MPSINPRALFDKLNATCTRGLQSAAGLCLSRTHFHVEIEHWLLVLLEQPNTDLPVIFRQFSIDPSQVKAQLNAALNRFKTGNGRAPDLSTEILDLSREAWVLSSLEYSSTKVRSGYLLVAALNDRMLSMRLKTSSAELGKLPEERLFKEIRELLAKSKTEENEQEAAARASSPDADAGGDLTTASSSQKESKGPSCSDLLFQKLYRPRYILHYEDQSHSILNKLTSH